MKEPFVDVGSLIDQTKLLSDMELQAYLASLPDRGMFTAQNVQQAINSVKTVKEHRFLDMAEKITGADNSVTSTAYYLARTSDLRDLAQDVDNVATKQLNKDTVDHDLVSRQHEINEWSNRNKMDTLYFMQVLFLCLTFQGFMVFLASQGLVTSTIFTYVAVLTAVIAVYVLVSRTRYTNILRDPRYWHKARFGTLPDPFPPSPSSQCP